MIETNNLDAEMVSEFSQDGMFLKEFESRQVLAQLDGLGNVETQHLSAGTLYLVCFGKQTFWLKPNEILTLKSILNKCISLDVLIKNLRPFAC